MTVLGRFCARAFSSCGKRGPLFIAVRGPLTIVASLVVEHRLQTHKLSNCGSRAHSLRGVWDLPRPGLEPVSPALAGRLSTTAPPGKPNTVKIWMTNSHFWKKKTYRVFKKRDMIIEPLMERHGSRELGNFSAYFVREEKNYRFFLNLRVGETWVQESVL